MKSLRIKLRKINLRYVNHLLVGAIILGVLGVIIFLPKTKNYDSNSSQRPEIPGAKILIEVVDDKNNKITEGLVNVSVRYNGEDSIYNYDYTYNLESLVYPPNNKLLPLGEATNSGVESISVWITTPSGEKSDTLVIKSGEYSRAVEKTTCDYAGKHQFILNSSGEIKNLDYAIDCSNDNNTRNEIQNSAVGKKFDQLMSYFFGEVL